MSFTFSSRSKEPTSMEDGASFFSRLFVLYLNPLFAKGAAANGDQQIELSDLGLTSKQDQSLLLFVEFTKQWEHERRLLPEKRSLWYVLWRTVGYGTLFKAIGLYLGYSASSFGPIMILNALVKHFQGTDRLSTPTLWILVALMFVIPMVGTILAAQSNIIVAHIGVQFRNTLVDVIYRKSLRLSPSARQQSSTGQIVNMFSSDTAQLQRFLTFMNNIVVALPMIVICLWLIYYQVGVATFVGLGLIIIVIPLNGIVFYWLGEVRKLKVLQTDKRVKVMNEILNGIRIIKFYSWETAFRERVEAVRIKELKLLRKIAYIIAIGFSIVLMAVPTFLPVLIFYAYIRLGNQLDAARAFTAISLFNLMQFPFIFLPLGLTQYSQSRVATQRILKFLDLEELAPYVDKTVPADGSTVIEMSHVSMSWVDAASVAEKQASDAVETAAKNAKMERQAHAQGYKTAAAQKAAADKKSSFSTAAAGPSSYAQVPTADGDVEAGKGEIELTAATTAVAEDTKNTPGAETSTLLPTSADATTASAGSEVDAKTSIKYDADLNRSVHTLVDMTFKIQKGELVAVVGTVGSGKSSFLNGLLGEMQLTQGSVRVHGRIAYCDQRPWILNDTVQGNVTFGLPYDEARFDAALYAANMEDDVIVLPGGINTQIGERGINLSGGQKARVAFARAIYCDADVYLLDDPLSAVDAHVGQFLFHEGIRNSLKGKTRILVTHQVHLLPFFDKIIVIDNGQIKAFGHYEELRRSGIDIEAYIPAATEAAAEEGRSSSSQLGGSARTTPHSTPHSTPGTLSQAQRKHLKPPNAATAAATTPGSKATTDNSVSASDVAVTLHKQQQQQQQQPSATNTNGNSPTRKFEEVNEEDFKVNREKAASQAAQRRQDTRATTLNSKEERSQGDVNAGIYTYYIKSGGWALFAGLSLFIVANQSAIILSSYWLSYWGDISVRKEDDGKELSTSRNVYFLNIFAVLNCIALVFYLLRSIALANHRLSSSVQLHRGLLKATLFAPIGFFDVTPTGRILNRFSSDLQTIDEEISQSVSQGLNSVASVIAAIGAIAGATKGTFLILLIPIVFFYNSIQKFFKATNTSIARLEAISRSPIYADFSQALNGMCTIRAYADEARFIKGLEACVDANSIANVTQQIASQWLAIRLDLIGALISFFIAVVAAGAPGFIPPGYLALALTYSFQLTTYLKFLVRMMAQLEAQLNSVERVKYYMDNIEVEGVHMQDKQLPPSEIPVEWPSKGVITGKDIDMRYRDGPLVLKGLSFDVQGAEKVGVAGRTGSGKSSLMVGLFRIQELAAGSITIDDIDISRVPLSLLRSKLGIIPQDPVMFSATVRFNLDPFDTHSDEAIWTVLESINMKEHVLSLPAKLLEEVAEGGDNFSAGQRQLICIARAILRKPKILVLDEATASIDNETDALVQRMVREQFQQCTVLTIAHRLNTIIDSDKIMVMDDGKMAEFDSPQRLLAVPTGLFRSLWDRHLESHGNSQE